MRILPCRSVLVHYHWSSVCSKKNIWMSTACLCQSHRVWQQITVSPHINLLISNPVTACSHRFTFCKSPSFKHENSKTKIVIMLASNVSKWHPKIWGQSQKIRVNPKILVFLWGILGSIPKIWNWFGMTPIKLGSSQINPKTHQNFWVKSQFYFTWQSPITPYKKRGTISTATSAQ